MPGWNTTPAPTHGFINDKPFDAGLPFAATVGKEAKRLGYGAYRVYVDEHEIVDPASAPENIAAGAKIRLAPWDKAGN